MAKKKENIKKENQNNNVEVEVKISADEIVDIIKKQLDDMREDVDTTKEDNYFNFEIKYPVSEKDTASSLTKFLTEIIADSVSDFFKARKNTKENLSRVAKNMDDKDSFIFCTRNEKMNYEVLSKCDQQEKINLIVRLLDNEGDVEALTKVLKLIKKKK